jgi:hypothetical protein
MSFYIMLPSLLATAAATASLALGSVVVFNDFGTGDSFMPGPGIMVGCGAQCWSNEGYSHAWSFVSPVTGNLSAVEWVAFLGPAPAGILTVGINSDAGGVPGPYLESFGAPVPPSPGHFTFSSGLKPQLVAGQTYWFTAMTMDLVDQAAQLGINSVGVTGPEALRLDAGPWMPTTSTAYPVFRITADVPVPEPSTAAFILTGCAVVIWTRARRRWLWPR